MEPVHWIESFLDLNAEKVPGPPGRWRRVYREGDVRTVLEWANMHILEERRLMNLIDARAEEQHERRVERVR